MLIRFLPLLCRGYLGDVELAAPLLALSREPDVEVAARVCAASA